MVLSQSVRKINFDRRLSKKNYFWLDCDGTCHNWSKKMNFVRQKSSKNSTFWLIVTVPSQSCRFTFCNLSHGFFARPSHQNIFFFLCLHLDLYWYKLLTTPKEHSVEVTSFPGTIDTAVPHSIVSHGGTGEVTGHLQCREKMNMGWN